MSNSENTQTIQLTPLISSVSPAPTKSGQQETDIEPKMSDDENNYRRLLIKDGFFDSLPDFDIYVLGNVVNQQNERRLGCYSSMLQEQAREIKTLKEEVQRLREKLATIKVSVSRAKTGVLEKQIERYRENLAAMKVVVAGKK